MVKVGDTAPDFTLKNTSKEAVTLSEHHGKTVILAFYPGAFTGVCDKEMCSFQENLAKLNDCNATVFGISVDSPWANGEFAACVTHSFPRSNPEAVREQAFLQFVHVVYTLHNRSRLQPHLFSSDVTSLTRSARYIWQSN